MEISSSLKRKSILALGVYLCFFIATIGTVSYLVVEPPVRDKLERNLDLKTQLLAVQVEEPLNSAIGVLHSIASLGESDQPQPIQEKFLYSLFKTLDNIAVSGGVWPEPYTVDQNEAYKSLFYNRASDGKVDKIESWNNASAGGYDNEAWYTVAVNEPAGSVFWSEVYIDAYTHVQMITATSPYYIDGKFAGVATVDLSLVNLINFVRRHASEFDLGVILKDGFNDVITEYNFKKSQTIYISSHQFGGFNWSIDVVNAKRTVNDEVYELVSNVELGIIPIMLLCVMVGYYLINQYLIKPIILIAKKVDDSKEGGIIEVNYRSHDEIRRLIDTFNQKTGFIEAEKEKAQVSAQAKSAFLATLSHEIRTPMNGVLGTAQILLKDNLTADQRKHLNSLYESGDHMMTLLNEILDFSKIEQGHLEFDRTAFPLDSIIGSINSVYHTLCTEKGLQFKVYSEIPSGRWYHADKARLRQILFNLINNAVKFTSRGFVEVYLKEKKVGQDVQLLIKVRDTGIGISKEAQGRIFKPFEQAESSTTRRFGGTGLGLAIVKQIVDLNGGDIEVTSEIGIGTSFDVALAIQPTAAGSVEMQVHRKLNYDGLKVLVVEDNRTNTIIIETFMKNKGFTCDCVENGEQALQAVAQVQYDLVLMDNHMPVMDGVEATSGIRSMSGAMAQVLIFGCTADVFKETRERMLGAGVDYIISKPIDESELDDALYRYASKLYQYHPETRKPVSASLSEDMLVRLYVELENRQYLRAKEAIETILDALEDCKDPTLMDRLMNIQRCLELEESPSDEDVDVITVMLAEYCK
ncbi:hybrid sensor histidine kinase/response regulator [uncultured Vibrio sp.]|uniref:hybrid sensor histidine kinase/response regulator n=1 Tax=uncultured Vibrio sp. TaxID=114054 RepID=UPI000915E46E|nr:hybrid sensor histidine kinase/response regulator [uncultured Vibrio sp.]OIQ26685.1 MAG: histidine kinase [Vibrio sp. MedPE-SWchi]